MAIVVDIKANTAGLSGPIQSAGMTAKRAAARVDALDQALQGLGSSINGVIRRVNALSNRMNSLMPSSGGSPSGSGGGGRGGAPKAPPVQATAYDWANYWQRINRASGGKYKAQQSAAVADAIQQLHGQASGGNAGAVRKLAAMQAMQMRGQGGIGQKLMNLVYSTRFGIGGGGGVQPLIGRTMQALSAIHPAAGAAVTGITLMTTAAMAAANRLNGIAMGQAIGGGPAGQSAAVNRAAQYFGMSGPELAQRLQSGLESGYGPGAAARYGINPVGGPFGDNKYNAKVIKFLRGLGNETSFEEARRRAEMVGMPELADFQKLSKADRESLIQDVGGSESAIDAARRLNLVMARMTKLLDRVAVLAEPFIRILEMQIRTFEIASKVYTAPFDGWTKMIDEAKRALNGGNQKSQTERNTNAVEQNTKQLKEFNQVFGGGDRARGAVPRAMKGKIGIYGGVESSGVYGTGVM